MSNKTNPFLTQLENKYQAKMDAACIMTEQFMIDMLQITIHVTEGWGYKRIKRLTEAWMDMCKEFKTCLDSDNPEADYYQEKLDRVLKEVVNDKQEFYSYKERYKYQPEIKYKRR